MANVSWNGGSGVWDTATLWSSGAIPGAANAATIDAAGSYTVTLNGTADAAGSILLNATAATLAIDGTLALGGTLAADAGTLSLGSGGVIDGGTLAMAGATLVGLGGTLNGVTAVGPLALTEAGNFVTVMGGLTLRGAGGSGPGTLALSGNNDTMSIADAESLDNMVIALGTGASGFGAAIDVGSTLTLGATASLVLAGTTAFASVSNPGGNPATFRNVGSIAITGAGSTLDIALGDFENIGSISIASGGVLEVTHFGSGGGTFSNTGAITFGAGGELIVGNAVSPTDLAGVTLNGGTLLIENAFNNVGQVLTTTTSGVFSNVVLTFGGTIVGGTIAPAGGRFASQGGTFDGVTWNSTLLAPGGALTVISGLTLAPGSDTLDLSAGGAFTARDAETLDNLLIRLGNGAAIGAAGSGSLTLEAGALTTLSAAGGTATISGGTVSNAGTIQVSGGLLSITASAFSNPGAIETSGGTVDFAGSVTAASFGNVINTGGTVEIGGTFVNTGATLTLPGTGTFSNIVLAGTLQGGTVQPAGGRIGFVRPAVLAGVTYDGPLDLSADQAYVDISGGTTLNGTNGTGAGAVLLTGGEAELEVSATTTLDNATITAGNAQSSTADPFFGDQLSIDSKLVLGPNLVLIDQGPAAAGTLAGADLLITGGTLDNAGTMQALAAGGTLEIATLKFVNTGTISLAAGAVVEILANLTPADLGSIENSGGTVDFGGGILTNTGTSLDITAGGALSTVLFGGAEILGGTIVVNGGTAQFAGGELDGVTFDGAMDLSAPESSVQITGGIALHGSGGSGAGSIDLTGAGGNLTVLDSETLDAATIEIGNAATADAITTDFGGTLTFGANLLVQETGTGAMGVIGGFGTIVNAGTIRAAGPNGGLTIDPAGGFNNQGSLEIGAGGLLAINFAGGNAASIGSLTNSGGTLEILGTLNNAGSLLDITAGSPFAGALLDGELTGGTVAMDGGTLEYAGTSLGSGGGTLSAITVKGALDLSTAFATLLLENGVSLVANGATAASVNLTGAGAHLAMADNETLDNAAISIGNAATSDVLQTNGTLTLGAGLLLTESAAGARASISGVALVNAGTIAADAAGGELTLGVSNFVNTGLLSIGAGGLLSVNANGPLANLGSIVNAGGTLGLTGTIANAGSTLVIGSSGAFSDVLLNGTIDGGTVELDGGVLQFGSVAAFNGVTFIGPTIDLGSSGAGLLVAPGTTLSSGSASPLIILVDGEPTKFLTFDGGTTLDDADILVSGTADQLDVGLLAPGTVTFAVDTSIDIAGNTRVILGTSSNSATLATAGTIHVANAGTLSIAAPALLDSGTIAVDAGAVLQVIDTVLPLNGWIGSVVGTGATLQVDAAELDLGSGTLSSSPSSAFAALQNFGTIANGTIINHGSYQANISVLRNISFDGVLDLSAPAQREVEENGLSLHGVDGTSPGTVVLTGLGSQLQFEDSSTLDHATVTLAGGPTLVAAGTQTTAITFVSDLTLGSGLTINATTSGAVSQILGDGVLSNAATINIGAGASLLINPPGFGGTSFINNGAINLAAGGTLAVDAVTTTGNLADIHNSGGTLLLGGTLNNAGATISVGPSGVFSNLVLGAPALQLNDGSIANDGGALAFAGNDVLSGVQFSGPLHVGNGAVVTFTNTSTLAPGAVSIDGSAVLTLPTLIAGQSVGLASGVFSDAGGGDAGGSFTFDGNATLELQVPLEFLTPIIAFGPGRTIDLPDSTVTGLAYAGGTLSAQNGTNTVATLLIGTGYHLGDINFAGDGGAGTDLTSTSFACFASGTRILTARGEVRVEALRVGDRVIALRAGRHARVRWIGHRHVDLRRHSRPCDANPVRIRAHAFGAGRPHTDLLLSPDHAVFCNGTLIPARHLINGGTVTQEAVASITYWHVELDRHEALLATGLAAESYLDTGNRAVFEYGSDHHRWQGRRLVEQAGDNA